MGILEIIFFVLLFLALIPYAIYPALIFVFARVFPRQWEEDNIEPKVAVIIPAFNEEAVIGAKIANTLALEYPENKIKVIIVSDGSTDRTFEVAGGVRDSRLEVRKNSENRGKAAVINEAVKTADAEIVIITDASAILEKDALRNLLRPFSDMNIGGTCGALVVGDRTGTAAYRSFENFLRENESIRHSTLGATGALYAFRKELFRELKQNAVLDDLFVPLEIIRAGKRFIFVPKARVREAEPENIRREFLRKARTLGGNWQVFANIPGSLVPIWSRVAPGMWGHRVLRVSSPFVLAGLLGITIALIMNRSGIVFDAALVAQAAAYLAGFAGGIFGFKGILGWPWTFMVFEAAAAWGLALFVFGGLEKKWRETAEKR